MKLEHIGIAVKSLGVSDELFAKLLGKESYKQETVEREGVVTSFYETGESKIELLKPVILKVRSPNSLKKGRRHPSSGIWRRKYPGGSEKTEKRRISIYLRRTERRC
jgi:hypothetical protein